MSETVIDPAAQTELSLGDSSRERSLLDQLLADSKLYRGSAEFQQLLDFAVRLRNMAPFNALLLQIQKPGLSYAASARDWKERFERTVKEKSRPLLILKPFGPVALVYDLLDTEGKELPPDAFSFYATGPIDDNRIAVFSETLAKAQIFIKTYDQGDNDAGFIRRMTIAPDKKSHSRYELGMNRNHAAPMRFATLAHELGHLFLGHLGDDSKWQIHGRSPEKRIREIEAEAVAYMVCKRNGVEVRSQRYLSEYVSDEDSSETLDLYTITKAAGHVERLLHLSARMEWLEDKQET